MMTKKQRQNFFKRIENMETRSREAFKWFSEVIWGDFGGIHVSYHQKAETLLTFFVLVQLQQ